MHVNIDYQKLGARLKLQREAKQITQEALAAVCGLSNNYISNIERNRSIPSLETVVSLCTALDITPDALLCDSLSTRSAYIWDEIGAKLQQLRPKNLILVSKFVSLLLEEQE